MIELGTKVIARTYSAGVHYGTLKSRDGQTVVLSDAIRIWYWDGAFTLSALAMEGTSKPENCKFSIPVNEIEIDRIELIPCTDVAIASIEKVKAHDPS